MAQQDSSQHGLQDPHSQTHGGLAVQTIILRGVRLGGRASGGEEHPYRRRAGNQVGPSLPLPGYCLDLLGYNPTITLSDRLAMNTVRKT